MGFQIDAQKLEKYEVASVRKVLGSEPVRDTSVDNTFAKVFVFEKILAKITQFAVSFNFKIGEDGGF